MNRGWTSNRALKLWVHAVTSCAPARGNSRILQLTGAVAFPLCASTLLCAACAATKPPVPTSPQTVQASCGVKEQVLLSRKQALCIAGKSGAGMPVQLWAAKKKLDESSNQPIWSIMAIVKPASNCRPPEGVTIDI